VGMFRKQKSPDSDSTLLGRAIADHETSTRIGDLEPRNTVEVIGRVEHIATVQLDGSVAFEIEISDGTGSLVALWTGRNSIVCVERGRRIALWGRAAPMRREHSLVVYNPRYELLP
jgi:RecG-like helicase